jgi:hypothetical protein
MIVRPVKPFYSVRKNWRIVAQLFAQISGISALGLAKNPSFAWLVWLSGFWHGPC